MRHAVCSAGPAACARAALCRRGRLCYPYCALFRGQVSKLSCHPDCGCLGKALKSPVGNFNRQDTEVALERLLAPPIFLQHRDILVPYRKIAEGLVNCSPGSANERRSRQTLCASEVVHHDAKLVKLQAHTLVKGSGQRIRITDRKIGSSGISVGP